MRVVLARTLSLAAIVSLATLAAAGCGNAEGTSGTAAARVCPASTPIPYLALDDEAAADERCVAAPSFAACTVDADCASPQVCRGVDASGGGPGICTLFAFESFDSVTPTCGPGAVYPPRLPTIDGSPSTFPFVGVATCLEDCSNGQSCPAGFACSVTSPGADGGVPVAGCVPHCTDDSVCGAGASCNLSTHLCGPVDDTLASNGGPCALGPDCKSGVCIGGTAGRGAATGYLDGMCLGSCVVPPDRAYQSATLPSADCPDDDVCVRDPAIGAGKLSECLPRCTSDTECRTDYVCVHPAAPGTNVRSTDGFCDARVDSLSKT